MGARVAALSRWKGPHIGRPSPRQSDPPRHPLRSPVDEVHSLLLYRIGIPSEFLPEI